MRGKLVASVTMAAGVALFCVGTSAHHGAAAYDTSTTTTVTGKVTQFRFINPHVLIYIAVAGEEGTVVEWSGELTSPNRLARSERNPFAWHKDLMKPGDEITLMGNPARNGAPSLRLLKVVDSGGTALIGANR